MPLKYYNQPPYYDDFDATKNYVRVLFRPGYAVQARELTQLQTAIQAQIERIGNHLFKNGTTVLGGETLLDTKYAYVKLEQSFDYPETTGGTTYYPEGGSGFLPYYATSVGCTITGMTSGVTATVLQAVPSTDSGDPLTIYVAYKSAGTDNVTHNFAPGEILTYTDADTNVRYFKVAATSPIGYGSRVSITEGVYFISGNFVYTPKESIIISKYRQDPSVRVVYEVTESIVSTENDATLADNALGTPNTSAPGADRYQISLNLTAEPLADEHRTKENIIQLLVIKSGQVTAKARVEYSELAKTLAIRTYEESGDYTITPFRLNVREYLRTGTFTTNGGVFTQSQIMAAEGFTGPTSGADAIAFGRDRLAFCLEPAIAYVNGFRIQTLDVTYVPVEKARDTAYINEAAIYCPLGGYVLVTDVVGLPNITRYTPITLKAGATTIGSARARGFTFDDPYYRLYLFDIQMNTNRSFTEVTSFSDPSVDGYDFSADAVIASGVGYTQLLETSTSSLLYKLPVNSVSTLREPGDISGFTYTVRRAFGPYTVSASNKISITVTTDEVFISDIKDDYVCTNSTGCTGISPGSIIPVSSLSGVGTSTIEITFSGANVNSGDTIYVIAPTSRTGNTFKEKTKSLQQGTTVTIASPNTTIGLYDSLGKSDILRINNIYMSPDFDTAPTSAHTDVTDRYELDDGQRENFYELGRIRLKPGSSIPTGQLLVDFDYFTHGAGDYFTVDSYLLSASPITLEEIPSFKSIKGTIYLGDAIDFRPTKGVAGTFGSGDSGSNITCTVSPGNVVRTDITHYLPRIDKIYVNKNGDFGVVKGISSPNPKPPADPIDAMVLYVASLNAYTYSVTDLAVSMVDNRRYTMRDIGRLEKRLANVEYYTSLSMLENDTAQKQIIDENNQVRYKNGFVADQFKDHNIGAVDHPDYHCSMDFTRGICRPEIVSDYVALLWNSLQSSGIKKTGPLITLDYAETKLIEQPYASDAEYINPHSATGWRGQIVLSPPGDDWKETLVNPVIASTASERWAWFTETDLLQAGYYTSPYVKYVPWVYNDWAYEWYSEINEEGLLVNLKRDLSAEGKTEIPGAPKGWIARIRTDAFGRPIDPNPSSTNVVDDKIVGTSVIPYIRSRKIYFRATGLKPNSRVYPFFDNIDISDYVRPLGSGESFVEYSTNPDNKNYIDATSHPDGADVLVSNADGVVEGTFIIPNNSAIKFSTGSRMFRLIDNSLNDPEASYTYAEAVYSASGLLEMHEQTIVSTAPPIVVPKPAPSDTVVAPSAPGVSISNDGAIPHYSGIPFNLVARASAGSPGQGGGITKIEIFTRYSPNFLGQGGSWSSLGSESYNYVMAAAYGTREYDTTPGYHEYKAVLTVLDSATYESGVFSIFLEPMPAELSSAPVTYTSTFYSNAPTIESNLTIDYVPIISP